jgi:hypothetical protein
MASNAVKRPDLFAPYKRKFIPTSTCRAGPAEVGRPKERRPQVAAEDAVVHVIEETERLRVEFHAEALIGGVPATATAATVATASSRPSTTTAALRTASTTAAETARGWSANARAAVPAGEDGAA